MHCPCLQFAVLHETGSWPLYILGMLLVLIGLFVIADASVRLDAKQLADSDPSEPPSTRTPWTSPALNDPTEFPTGNRRASAYQMPSPSLLMRDGVVHEQLRRRSVVTGLETGADGPRRLSTPLPPPRKSLIAAGFDFLGLGLEPNSHPKNLKPVTV